MVQPRAADDLAAIRAQTEELKRDRDLGGRERTMQDLGSPKS